MYIESGYYISERTSLDKPIAYIDSNTLYLPFDVSENDEDEGGYKFKEYRVKIPIAKDISVDVLKQIIEQVPNVIEVINETLEEIFGKSASIKKSKEYRSTVEAVKERIASEDDKTFGIACCGIFPTWTFGIYIEGDVATHPETGYPYECRMAHDSTVNTDWTINSRTIWVPWHSCSAEYALPWEAPTGAHDMYKVGEYMVWTDGNIYECLVNTDRDPEVLPDHWRLVE